MNSKRFLIWLLIPVVFGSLAHAQNASSKTSFTMKEAIDYALLNNDSIKLAQADIEIAKAQILETKSIGLPQVNASLDAQYYFKIPTQVLPDFISPAVYGVLFNEGVLTPRTIPTGQSVPAQFGTNYNIKAGVTANQMIFNGEYLIGLRATRVVKELSASMLNTTEINIQANVSRLYLQSIVMEKTIEVLLLNQSELVKNIAELTALNKEGLIDQMDVDRLILTQQKIENQINKTVQSGVVLKLLLKLQMGYPVESNLELADDFEQFVTIQDALLTESANPSNRPEYKTLLLNQEAQDLQAKRWKAGYLPTLNAFFNYSQSALVNEINQIDKDHWYPTSIGGITLGVPIFDGLNKSAKIQQAKINAEKAEIQMHQFEEGVRLQIQSAQQNYESAIANYNVEKQSLELSEKIYNRAKIKYSEGVGSSLEVSTALTDFYNSQSSFLNASYQLVASKINLEKALGKFN